MNYRIFVTKKARKQLEKLDTPVRKKAKNVIDQLAKQPFPVNVKQIKGKFDGFYRVKFARDWRIIYHVNKAEIVITVIRVGHRKDIYS